MKVAKKVRVNQSMVNQITDRGSVNLVSSSRCHLLNVLTSREIANFSSVFSLLSK